jgi:hypothetical protein
MLHYARGGTQSYGCASECWEPMTMGWMVSQLMTDAGANALEPCAASYFMQLDGHRGDGE